MLSPDQIHRFFEKNAISLRKEPPTRCPCGGSKGGGRPHPLSLMRRRGAAAPLEPPALIMLSPDQIHRFFEKLAQANPTPRIELNYTTPFTLLVAVVLSAQSTDTQVNKVTAPLFAIANTPQAFIALGEEGLASYIRSIGLFKTKARHLIRLSQILIEKYDGQVPSQRSELETLPGVGRKSANVILNVTFGQSTIAVDRHIFRVANRCGLASEKLPWPLNRL